MGVDLDKFTLKAGSLFSLMEPEQARYAREHLSVRSFRNGYELYRKGSYAKGVYIVRKGKIKISYINDDGRESIIYVYKRGEYFGYRPLIADEPYPVTATALDNSEVFFLPAAVFTELLENSESFARHLLVNLSSEFTVWINKITVFAQYAVKQRVALSLLILCQVYGTETRSKPSVSIGRDDLASFVGTAKETLVRMLRVFKDENIVSAKGARITILRPQALIDVLKDV